MKVNFQKVFSHFLEKFVEIQKLYPTIDNPQKFEKYVDTCFHDWKTRSKVKKPNFYAWMYGRIVDLIIITGNRHPELWGETNDTPFEDLPFQIWWNKTLGFTNATADTMRTFIKEFLKEYEKRFNVYLHTDWERN